MRLPISSNVQGLTGGYFWDTGQHCERKDSKWVISTTSKTRKHKRVAGFFAVAVGSAAYQGSPLLCLPTMSRICFGGFWCYLRSNIATMGVCAVPACSVRNPVHQGSQRMLESGERQDFRGPLQLLASADTKCPPTQNRHTHYRRAKTWGTFTTTRTPIVMNRGDPGKYLGDPMLRFWG